MATPAEGSGQNRNVFRRNHPFHEEHLKTEGENSRMNWFSGLFPYVVALLIIVAVFTAGVEILMIRDRKKKEKQALSGRESDRGKRK